MALNDNGVAQGTPVNLTGGIGDVPGKPFGGREDYAFSPDGSAVAFSVKAGADEAWSTNFDVYTVAADGAAPPKNLTTDNKAWDGQRCFLPTVRNLRTWPWIGPVSRRTDFIWCSSICSRASSAR